MLVYVLKGKLIIYQALYEVMTVISNDAPHRYLHNGVSLGDVRRMAKVFYKMLLEKNGGKK